MFRTYLIAFLLLTHLFAFTQWDDFKLKWPYGTEQSRFKYDSIRLDPVREHTRECNREKGVVLREYCFIKLMTTNNWLIYERNYHLNGKMRSEGLYAGKPQGTWFYYDTLGLLYGEYNYYTRTYKEHRALTSSFQWAFDSVRRQGTRFMLNLYDPVFITEHFNIDVMNWLSVNPRILSALPEMPSQRPVHIGINFCVVYDGRRIPYPYRLGFDKDFKLNDKPDPKLLGRFEPGVKVSYKDATALAQKKGFDDECWLAVGDERLNKPGQPIYLHWTTYRYDTIQKTLRHYKTREKHIYINAFTGKYEITKYTSTYENYNWFWWPMRKHKVVKKKDFKEVQFREVYLSVPDNWRVVKTEYDPGHQAKETWFINNSDTVELTCVCTQTAAPPIDLKRDDENIAVVFDTVLNRRAHLSPWGRYTLDVRKQNNDLKITACFYREGTITFCGKDFYYVTIKRLGHRQQDYLEILNTFRFFSWDYGNGKKKKKGRP